MSTRFSLRSWRPRHAAVLLLLVFAGCDGTDAPEPRAIHLHGPEQRPAALGQEVRLQVALPGPKRKTLLGGSRQTVAANEPVAFALVKQPENAGGSLRGTDVETDSGGTAVTYLHVGDRPGRYVVEARLPRHPKIQPVRFLVLGGLVLRGDKQDGHVGAPLKTPVTLYAESAPGIPLSGARVHFEGTGGVEILTADTVTDEHGEAEAFVELGGKMGRGGVTARIQSAPWKDTDSIPALEASLFALDWTSLAIEVIGGLAIFIFGMRNMSEGLSLVAGSRLRTILNALTRNRFLAVLAGLITTGLIQSSSACSVMVIGFVNAGLMQLEQAIGVIMGANIGTTVTAQMLSFKLGVLALPAVSAGVLLLLVSKRQNTRFWAQILIGFGLLFFGMHLMGAPLKQLKDSGTIVSFFDGLSCAPDAAGSMPTGMILRAIAVGTVMTLVVQSSSASIGLLLAMAGAGLLDVYTATAVLLGDNIGTTITAVLASIGSSRTAKRTACAHVLFNVTGVLVMVLLFHVSWNGQPVFIEMVHRLTAGDPYKGENLPRFLANAHTLFNISCTVLFVGFIASFALLCRWIVPGEEPAEAPVTRLLDPYLLATPGIALGQAWSEVGVMLRKSHEAHRTSFRAVLQPDGAPWEEIDQQVREHERQIDDLQAAVNSYVTHLSQESLTEEQGEILPHLLHSVNDAERIGDHSMHLLRLARRRRKQSIPLPENILRELETIYGTIESLFHLCAQTLEDAHEIDRDTEGRERLGQARELIRTLKRQTKQTRKAHEARSLEGQRQVPGSVILVDTLANLHRVGAHLENILQALLLGHPEETGA